MASMTCPTVEGAGFPDFQLLQQQLRRPLPPQLAPHVMLPVDLASAFNPIVDAKLFDALLKSMGIQEMLTSALLRKNIPSLEGVLRRVNEGNAELRQALFSTYNQMYPHMVPLLPIILGQQITGNPLGKPVFSPVHAIEMPLESTLPMNLAPAASPSSEVSLQPEFSMPAAPAAPTKQQKTKSPSKSPRTSKPKFGQSFSPPPPPASPRVLPPVPLFPEDSPSRIQGKKGKGKSHEDIDVVDPGIPGGKGALSKGGYQKYMEACDEEYVDEGDEDDVVILPEPRRRKKQPKGAADSELAFTSSVNPAAALLSAAKAQQKKASGHRKNASPSSGKQRKRKPANRDDDYVPTQSVSAVLGRSSSTSAARKRRVPEPLEQTDREKIGNEEIPPFGTDMPSQLSQLPQAQVPQFTVSLSPETTTGSASKPLRLVQSWVDVASHYKRARMTLPVAESVEPPQQKFQQVNSPVTPELRDSEAQEQEMAMAPTGDRLSERPLSLPSDSGYAVAPSMALPQAALATLRTKNEPEAWDPLRMEDDAPTIPAAMPSAIP